MRLWCTLSFCFQLPPRIGINSMDLNEIRNECYILHQKKLNVLNVTADLFTTLYKRVQIYAPSPVPLVLNSMGISSKSDNWANFFLEKSSFNIPYEFIWKQFVHKLWICLVQRIVQRMPTDLETNCREWTPKTSWLNCRSTQGIDGNIRSYEIRYVFGYIWFDKSFNSRHCYFLYWVSIKYN